MPDTQIPSATPPILTWQAPIHVTHEKSSRWYVISAVVVTAIAIFAVLRGDWTFALVTVLCAGVYFLVRNHTFGAETIVMTEQGVTIANEFIAWADAQGYWFLITNTYAELHITPKARRNELVIQTGSTPLPLIREAIGGRIPELLEKKERFVDAFIRITKL
jgi:hypothetical protein